MTSADTEAMAALHELLEERQRYEGWILALEGRRASTPGHVFERVHTDYTLRLERVLQRLSERTGQLQATVEQLTSRLDGLKGREAERTDARHEAELRAAVGEFGEEEWARIRSDADRELDMIGEERRGVEEELAELRRIVELTRRAPGETAVVAQSDGAEADAQPQPKSRPEPPPQAKPEPQAATPPRPVELAASDRSPSALHIRPAAPGDTEAPSIDDFVADWPVRQLQQTQSDTTPQAQGDGIARVPEVDGTKTTLAAPPTTPRDFQPGPSTASNVPATTPSVEVRREQEKTLKCPECGTMNYATEWYCERCGGELATF